MKTPSCYNRDPFTDPNAGWVRTREYVSRLKKGWVAGETYEHPFQIKFVYRYRWPWFTDRCAAWDTGPGHVRDTVPARECWACDGCKHLPAHARAWIRGEDGDE